MFSFTLFKREIKANYKLLLIFVAVLAMYDSMIVAMFDPELGSSLEMMAQSMPQIFAAFSMLNVGSTLIEFVANYLYGFLLICFPLVFIILLNGKLLTRYLERGSMAYLLATPNSRAKIAFTQCLVLIKATAVMVLFNYGLCAILSELMFKGSMDQGKFLLLNVGWFGLLLFFGGISYFAACSFSDTRFAYGLGAGLPIAFVLMQMVSNVGDRFKFIKYANPLTLFNPSMIISGEAKGVYMFLILYAAAIALFAAGVAVFSRRDLAL